MSVESLGHEGGLGKLGAAAAVPLPFPGPLRVTGGVVGQGGSRRIPRAAQAAIGGDSGAAAACRENQENHHIPTLN